jgi:hypothetical protein
MGFKAEIDRTETLLIGRRNRPVRHKAPDKIR